MSKSFLWQNAFFFSMQREDIFINLENVGTSVFKKKMER